MISDRGALRDLFLSVALPGPSAPAHLLLDARTGRTGEAAGGAGGLEAPAAAVLVISGRRPEARARPGGGLLVTRPLLWSLLEPCRASVGATLAPVDAIAAERLLRDEGRRLWEGIARWRRLEAGLRGRCRELLAAYSAPVARLWDLLDALAAAGGSGPFDGWSDAAGAKGEGGAAPTVRPFPADPEGLAEWMVDPVGLGALYGEGFTPRPEQAEMARLVAGALAARRPLLVEAGTGGGKTLAYLAPLLAAAAAGGRVCVATHTRTLQAQILGHDLPLLRSLFPALRSRLLMGRRNYLCRRRRLRFLERPADSLAAAGAQVTFRLWLACTEEGLREELAGHPFLDAHLGELFDSAEPCSPSVCHAGGEECFVQRARRLARESDVVVVNHALLMNDFAAGRTLIGPYEHLVVDEAHRLPQAALDVFAIRLDLTRLAVIEELIGDVRESGAAPELLRQLAAVLAPLGEEAAGAATALGALGSAVAACFREYRDWLRGVGEAFDERVADGQRPPGRVRVYDGDETFGPLRSRTAGLVAAATAAGAAYAEVAQQFERLSVLPEGREGDLGTLARAGELLGALQRDVRFVTAAADPDWVVWLEPDAAAGVRAAGATRLESGDLLRECWRGAGLAPVVTSATLGVGEDFGHMLGELGLRRWQPPAVTALVPSPFDYERQALLLTLTDVPPPDRHDYLPAVASVLAGLLRAVRRKTLVLFTAYQSLQRVAAELEGGDRDLFSAGGSAPGPPLPPPVILAQTPGGETAALLARFRGERRAVLLGTTTFWEGLDFPGEELEILVVTKLPFLVPNDPWVEARCQRIQAGGENAFESFMVRDAVLRLRQGIGRLIRRASDRGVVILLDSRLHSKPYGVTFLGALPAPTRTCTDAGELVEQVARFFATP